LTSGTTDLGVPERTSRIAVSASDGKLLAEYGPDAAPVWDGIALANGRLYVALADDTVQCFGPSRQVLLDCD
jgi:hypothetical protein